MYGTLLVDFSLDSNLRNELHMCEIYQMYLSPVEISDM